MCHDADSFSGSTNSRNDLDLKLTTMKQKILFVLCLLFGLMFINAGLNKFLNYMPVPEEMPEDSMQLFTAMM